MVVGVFLITEQSCQRTDGILQAKHNIRFLFLHLHQSGEFAGEVGLLALQYIVFTAQPFDVVLFVPQLGSQHLNELLLLLVTSIAAHAYPSLMLLEAVLLVEAELRIVERQFLVLQRNDAALPSLTASLFGLLDGDVATGFQLVDELTGLLLIESIHAAEVSDLFVLLLGEVVVVGTWPRRAG